MKNISNIFIFILVVAFASFYWFSSTKQKSLETKLSEYKTVNTTLNKNIINVALLNSDLNKTILSMQKQIKKRESVLFEYYKRKELNKNAKINTLDDFITYATGL